MEIGGHQLGHQEVESHTPLIWFPNRRGTVGGTQQDTPEKPQKCSLRKRKSFKNPSGS